MSFLISLFSIVDTPDDVREYMGISYIKTYLKIKGLDCNARVICKEEMDEVLSSYEDFPKLIGISIYCNTLELVKLFCEKIKKLSPNCHIVLGGAHVMEYEVDILSRMKHVDSVCTGDGEETIWELADRLIHQKSLLNCKGITFRDGDKIIQNERRPDIKNLDLLPHPERERNPKNKKRYFYITGSRGCLGQCSFCGEHKTGGCGVRLRDPVDIVNEMEELWKQYGVDKFHFTDATFEDPGNKGIERAQKIFTELIERQLKFRLVMYTRTNIINKMNDKYYDLAYKAGVECFFVGVESGNQSDLNLYEKRITVQDNLKAIRTVLEHHIYVNYGFICFNPYSTFERIQENLDFLYHSGLVYNSYHILSKMTIMPQSSLKDKMLADKLIDEFHFDSDIRDYKFVHPEVLEFHSAIYKIINTKHLIDLDSQIAIDRIHYRKNEPLFYDQQLKGIFEEIEDVWNLRNHYLYNYFTEAIRIFKVDRNGDRFNSYIKDNKISEYDKKIATLYKKYTIVLYKYKKIGV